MDLYVEARDSDFTRSLGQVASEKSASALMSTGAGKLNLLLRAKRAICRPCTICVRCFGRRTDASAMNET